MFSYLQHYLKCTAAVHKLLHILEAAWMQHKVALLMQFNLMFRNCLHSRGRLTWRFMLISTLGKGTEEDEKLVKQKHLAVRRAKFK